jgi:ABC-type nickel/cobalt efflux system permease component RcnA
MENHWVQVRGTRLPARGVVVTLHTLGSVALLGSLLPCLRTDHASMAALVWVMALAAAALIVAFTLSWRPRVFAPLVAWVHTPEGSPEPRS